MSAVFEDILDSLNELKEAAEGKPTGLVVTPKSVEAREGGDSRPAAAGLMRDHPGFAENMGIYQ